MDEMDLMSQDMMQDMAALEAQMDQQMGLSVRARPIVSDIHTRISGDSAPPPPCLWSRSPPENIRILPVQESAQLRPSLVF